MVFKYLDNAVGSHDQDHLPFRGCELSTLNGSSPYRPLILSTNMSHVSLFIVDQFAVITLLSEVRS